MPIEDLYQAFKARIQAEAAINILPEINGDKL